MCSEITFFDVSVLTKNVESIREDVVRGISSRFKAANLPLQRCIENDSEVPNFSIMRIGMPNIAPAHQALREDLRVRYVTQVRT